jgi:hypothetical protein
LYAHATCFKTSFVSQLLQKFGLESSTQLTRAHLISNVHCPQCKATANVSETRLLREVTTEFAEGITLKQLHLKSYKLLVGRWILHFVLF